MGSFLGRPVCFVGRASAVEGVPEPLTLSKMPEMDASPVSIADTWPSPNKGQHFQNFVFLISLEIVQ